MGVWNIETVAVAELPARVWVDDSSVMTRGDLGAPPPSQIRHIVDPWGRGFLNRVIFGIGWILTTKVISEPGVSAGDEM